MPTPHRGDRATQVKTLTFVIFSSAAWMEAVSACFSVGPSMAPRMVRSPGARRAFRRMIVNSMCLPPHQSVLSSAYVSPGTAFVNAKYTISLIVSGRTFSGAS